MAIVSPKKPGPSELSFLSFDLVDLLQRVRVDFPDLETRHIQVFIRRHETLACVRFANHSPEILLHSVLNHADTPREVVEFILRHELLHLRIPPREVEGTLKIHPSEFWEAERELAPEREIAWAWVHGALGLSLRIDRKRERVLVTRGWYRSMRFQRQSWSDISAAHRIARASVTDYQETELPL